MGPCRRCGGGQDTPGGRRTWGYPVDARAGTGGYPVEGPEGAGVSSHRPHRVTRGESLPRSRGGGAHGPTLCNLTRSRRPRVIHHTPLPGATRETSNGGWPRRGGPAGLPGAMAARGAAPPLRRPPEAGAGWERLLNKSSWRRAYAQWIVTTRPLYHLHDPARRLSRMQRIHPHARSNCNTSAGGADFTRAPVADLLRFRARGLFVSEYGVWEKNHPSPAWILT